MELVQRYVKPGIDRGYEAGADQLGRESVTFRTIGGPIVVPRPGVRNAVLYVAVRPPNDTGLQRRTHEGGAMRRPRRSSAASPGWAARASSPAFEELASESSRRPSQLQCFRIEVQSEFAEHSGHLGEALAQFISREQAWDTPDRPTFPRGFDD
jgi:hypothetical protein